MTSILSGSGDYRRARHTLKRACERVTSFLRARESIGGLPEPFGGYRRRSTVFL